MTATLALVCLLQTTWIVDANNGPGTTHTDLPNAISAASSGDTVLVRPGSYSGFSTSGKALTIRGAGRSSTFVAGASIGALASGQLVLSGLTVRQPLTTAMSVRGVGSTLLLDCAVLGGSGDHALDIQLGSTVHAVRSRVVGGDNIGGRSSWNYAGNGVQVVDSALTGYACEFRGGYADGFGYVVGGQGVAGWNAVVELRDCTCIGGSANLGFLSAPIGGHGVSLSTSAVRLAGAGMIARGGAAIGVSASSRRQGVAVADYLGQTIVHAGVTLQPAVTGAAVTLGNVMQGLSRLPRLAFLGVTLASGETNAAQPMTVNYEGMLPNAPAFVAVGFTPDFVHQFPSQIGASFVQLSSSLIVPIVLDGQGRYSFTLTMAVALPLFGVPFHVQAATFDMAASELRTSNAQVRIFSL